MNQITLLNEMKDTGQDFEWYPTTDEIINAFFRDMTNRGIGTVLDVGDGNGKVLERINSLATATNRASKFELFAIEKSDLLIQAMPNHISIVGTDFWQQTLMDKRMDCVFSNPPYSQFVDWCEKLIREANAKYVYLVIPQRWRDNVRLQDAIKSRKASNKVLGEFDFISAEDRKARAKVDLVLINMRDMERGQYYRNSEQPLAVDPFDLWIDTHFKIEAPEKKQPANEERKEAIATELVAGKNLIETLEALYTSEMGKMLDNYQRVCGMDAELLEEIGVSLTSVKNSIKTKITGLKDAYWKELFDRYTPITERLTSSSRGKLLGKLREQTAIDFTASNAYAVTIWTIKNANHYFDAQLLDTYDMLVEKANVVNYKSNQRVFKFDRWRYNRNDDASTTHFALDYRIVLEKAGGIGGGYSWETVNNLSKRAAEFIDDLVTIARNLGYESDDSARSFTWESGKKYHFEAVEMATGKAVTLMEVKAYKNGNMHIKFHQRFMLALNVEYGRLRGWIHNAQQAASEMDKPLDEVKQVFKAQYQLLPANAGQLLLGHEK